MIFDHREEEPAVNGRPYSEPEPAEVESARILADQARDELEGIDDPTLRRWAEQFVTEVGTGGLPEFVAWVRGRGMT